VPHASGANACVASAGLELGRRGKYMICSGEFWSYASGVDEVQEGTKVSRRRLCGK
jgi:hypothetical protein